MQWSTWLMGDHVICKKFTAFSFVHNPHAIGKEYLAPTTSTDQSTVYAWLLLCFFLSSYSKWNPHIWKEFQQLLILHKPLNTGLSTLKTPFPSIIPGFFIAGFFINAFKALCEFNSSLLFFIWEKQGIEVIGMCTFVHQTKTREKCSEFPVQCLGLNFTYLNFSKFIT